MWKHACLVLATAAVASSFYTQYSFPQVVYSHPHVRAGQDQKYDCPREGFFINPKNCSQFYRCVDYTGTGYVYSVYAFECPRFHVFILDGDNSTCVPGTQCIQGPQTAAHVASTSTTTQSPSGPVGIDFPGGDGSTGGSGPITWWTPPTTASTTPAPSQGTDGSSTGGLRPLPVRPINTPPPVTPGPPTTPPTTSRPVVPSNPPVAPGPPVVDCRGQYVQHESFCNVYYKCSYRDDKFLCPAGSVFDTVRQMCRIQAADEDLCGGKSIYSTSFRFANTIPLGNIGSRTHLTDLSQYMVPQTQPNYLAYFNPNHPLRMNPSQTPLQYYQPITTGFTQTIIRHPEPENVHPRQYHRVVVVDNDRTTFSQNQPENVHPRQYHRQLQPELEIDNPRQYFRIIDETSKTVNPRQYYHFVDENTQNKAVPETIHPRQYHVPIDTQLDVDAREFY